MKIEIGQKVESIKPNFYFVGIVVKEFLRTDGRTIYQIQSKTKKCWLYEHNLKKYENI